MTGSEAPNAQTNNNFVQVATMDMETFDPDVEQWQTYMERMDQLFNASNIASKDQKRSLFIKFIGPRTYRLLRDLCQPELPKDVEFKKLVDLLKDHYTPAIVIFKERRAFYSAHKNPGESVVEWHARIRRLAVNCEFGSKLESTLIDKFVTEMDGKVFDRLCEEGTTLTLPKALEIAQRYETPSKAVNAIHHKKRNVSMVNRKKEGGRSKAVTSDEKCYHCGKSNHDFKMCKFKSYNCNICGKKGHLAAVCRETFTDC